MGWERKRGKIEEFNRLLRGATDTSFAVPRRRPGDPAAACGTASRSTATRACRATPRAQLIGIITHPLNRAGVRSARSAASPRATASCSRASASRSRAPPARCSRGSTPGTPASIPYTTAVSDTYQDLFGEGIFTGKGLYDVDAFTAALEDSVPENALLSHDLFEGLHARVALVSDVELVDDYPSSVLAHARRQHRWIRGDWQILFWLFPFVPSRHGIKRNTLPLIGRWKILDNLRRSLVAPDAAGAARRRLDGAAGSALVLDDDGAGASSRRSCCRSSARLLVGPRQGAVVPGVLAQSAATTRRPRSAQVVLGVTFLAYHAWETVHAIVLTLVRLAVTRRRLLEWETAAATAARAAGLVGAQGAAALRRRDDGEPDHRGRRRARWSSLDAPARCSSAAPFLLLWIVAPVVAYWLSLPVGAARAAARRRRARAAATDRAQDLALLRDVRHCGRRWLPPDNYQEDGDRAAARAAHLADQHRHGPAVDAGRARPRLSPDRRAGRAPRRTLTTLEGLERHEGHFLNWYDTATLAPLHPRYVSTVDSGNLAGALDRAGARAAASSTERPQTRAQLLDGSGRHRGAARGRVVVESTRIAPTRPSVR